MENHIWYLGAEHSYGLLYNVYKGKYTFFLINYYGTVNISIVCIRDYNTQYIIMQYKIHHVDVVKLELYLLFLFYYV